MTWTNEGRTFVIICGTQFMAVAKEEKMMRAFGGAIFSRKATRNLGKENFIHRKNLEKNITYGLARKNVQGSRNISDLKLGKRGKSLI